MALVNNNTAKQLSIADDAGTIVINPTESINIDDVRLKKLEKNIVVKSYFDAGYLKKGK